jgi:tetratricopeptide (TPR) repeat protein
MFFKPLQYLTSWWHRFTRRHKEIPEIKVQTVRPRDFYEQAVSCLERRDISGAIAKLQMAIARFPNYCPGYVRLAELLEREGDLLEAEKIATTGLQCNPDNNQQCKLLSIRGISRIHQDDFDGGIEDFKSISEITHSDNFKYFYDAAQSLAKHQRFDCAVAFLLKNKPYLTKTQNLLLFYRWFNLIQERHQSYNFDLKRVNDNSIIRFQKFCQQPMLELAICDGSLFPLPKYSTIPIRYEFSVNRPVSIPCQLDDFDGLIKQERRLCLSKMKLYEEKTQSILTLPDAILGEVGENRQFIVSQQGFYYKRDRRLGVGVTGYAIVHPITQTIETGYFLALAATANYYHRVVDIVSSLVQYPLQKLNCPLFIFSEQLELARRLVEGAGVDHERVQPISPEMGILVKTGFVPTAELSLDRRIGIMGRKIGEHILKKSGVRTAWNAERIYISRRKNSRRPLQNEVAVEMMLQKLGFQIVFMEDEPLEKQIAIVSDAKVIVAPHGAGLTNILFAPAGRILVELIPQSYQHLEFCELAHLCGHFYYPLFGKMGDTTDLSRDQNFYWWVDCDRLRDLLYHLLGNE